MSLKELADVVTFVARIIPIIEEYGGSVTSWHRSEAHNKAVGGVANSDHLQGLAADVVFDDPAVHNQFADAATNVGLHPWIEPDHVHVQASPLRTIK